MWPFSQWTTAGRAALIYSTIGALTMVWAGVWYGYLFNNPPTGGAYYWCTGFMVTGLTMVLIGLGLGMYSRSAQHADPPPAGVPLTVVNLQPNAAMAPAPALAAAPQRAQELGPGRTEPVALPKTAVLGDPRDPSCPSIATLSCGGTPRPKWL